MVVNGGQDLFTSILPKIFLYFHQKKNEINEDRILYLFKIVSMFFI